MITQMDCKNNIKFIKNNFLLSYSKRIHSNISNAVWDITFLGLTEAISCLLSIFPLSSVLTESMHHIIYMYIYKNVIFYP